MVPQPRPGTFSPNPAAQPIYTGLAHSPHPSHAGALSAGASPSTSSPTGSNSLTKIAVAQVYLLLSTIKEDKDDPRKFHSQTESLRKVMWPPAPFPHPASPQLVPAGRPLPVARRHSPTKHTS
jgi:CCR4-NOT transcription complex subunit 1